MDKERIVSLGNALQIFQDFHNKDEFFDRLTSDEDTFCTLANQLILLAISASGYGVIMGSYNGFLQAISSGIKLPFLFLLALLICFPAVFILQSSLGSKLGFWQMLKIILGGFVISAVVLIAFAPIVLFFTITGDNYSFLKLLHVAIFGLAGIFGMKTIIDALQFACEQKNVYPKVGVLIFRCWIIVLAFVGMQLSWSLRPFVGSREIPFEIFRKHEGNFYIAVIQAVGDLANPTKVKTGQGRSFLDQEFQADPTKNRNDQRQTVYDYVEGGVPVLSSSGEIPNRGHIAPHNPPLAIAGTGLVRGKIMDTDVLLENAILKGNNLSIFTGDSSGASPCVSLFIFDIKKGAIPENKSFVVRPDDHISSSSPIHLHYRWKDSNTDKIETGNAVSDYSLVLHFDKQTQTGITGTLQLEVLEKKIKLEGRFNARIINGDFAFTLLPSINISCQTQQYYNKTI